MNFQRKPIPAAVPVKLCKRGHPRTPENVESGRGCRLCRGVRRIIIFNRHKEDGVILEDTASLEGRFLAKVEKTDRCWIWQGLSNAKGYGRLHVDGRLMRSTHVAWFLRHGTVIPAGLLACHTCDNPRCVNPDHLFVSDAAGNNLDRELKRRGRYAREGVQ